MSGPTAAVTKEFTRMTKKQKTCRQTATKHVDSLIQELEQARAKLIAGQDSGDKMDVDNANGEATDGQPPTGAPSTTADGVVDTAAVLAELKSKLPAGTALTTALKEFHATISKTGKAIDKNFKTDPGAWSAGNKPLLPPLLCQVIAQSFYRQGRFDLGNKFREEASVDLGTEHVAPFKEMFEVASAIRARNLAPALAWCAERRDKLSELQSSLEFRLHRMQFLTLLQDAGTPRADVIAYARQKFSPFAEHHMSDISKLMTCLLYANRIEQSPYAHLCAPSQWADIELAFNRDACSLLGLSQENPLYTTVQAGAVALPTLLKLVTLMQTKPNNEWSSDDQHLPVEINLGPEAQFHSVFACPVSREQATKDNPPVMLPCSHVIALQSMVRLVRQGNSFKCPYCPSTQSIDEVVQLQF